MYDREGEMNFPKQSTNTLFVGAMHKINDATPDSLVAFQDLALQLPFISLGCK